MEQATHSLKRFVERQGDRAYDILVIGGGISGAAVAYEAASRGYSVALVEKGDFGGGTSAATSKLIHGGMRYLANREFGLVRESLKERRTLENIAPNLVYPLPFLVPLYDDGYRTKWIIEPGMILYDILSFDKGFTWDRSKRLPRHRLLSRQKAVELEPLVGADNLTGAIRFYDCASLMPERLTLAFIKSAASHGADTANHARVEDFVRTEDRVSGVVVRDLVNEKTLTLRGKLTINCGGPWADILLGTARGEPGALSIRRSEGIHLVTNQLTRQQTTAVGGVTPTGRACNLIPWRGHTLIGTTDREYIGDPDAYCVTRQHIEEYIAEVNAAFGDNLRLQYSDVLYAYGGLRPLLDDQTSDVRQTSRKYEIFDHEQEGLPGMVTVEGGKYTTSRNLAENVLQMVDRNFGTRPSKSVTSRRHLAGCEIRDIDAHVAEAKASYRDFPDHAVDYLARIYGTELPQVMEIARSDQQYAVALDSDGEMPAQALYAIRHEMACTLLDILIRRTGIGTLGHPGDEALERIAQVAARELNWDRSRADLELERAHQALAVPT